MPSRWRWRGCQEPTSEEPTSEVAPVADPAFPTLHESSVWRSPDGRIRVGWRVLMFVGLAVTLQQLTQPLVPTTLPWVTVPTLFGALVAGWILLWLEGRSPGALGFPLNATAAPRFALGLALGVALGLVAVALIAAAGGVRWSTDSGRVGDWVAAGLATLWLLALPAAAEEAMLRGYPLQALAEAWGAVWALLVTSAVFALLHLPNPGIGWVGLANIAAAGLFLGALYLRTRSLWWATGAHLGWNWAHAFLADLHVSGLEIVDAPLVDPVLSGPAWLSGGEFGPEGSVLATAAVLAAAAWIWRTPLLRNDRYRPEASPPMGDPS